MIWYDCRSCLVSDRSIVQLVYPFFALGTKSGREEIFANSVILSYFFLLAWFQRTSLPWKNVTSKKYSLQTSSWVSRLNFWAFFPFLSFSFFSFYGFVDWAIWTLEGIPWAGRLIPEGWVFILSINVVCQWSGLERLSLVIDIRHKAKLQFSIRCFFRS